MRRFKVPPSFIRDVVIPVLFVGGAMLLTYFLVGCTPGPDELPCSNVDVGQTVIAKIDGRRGMVTSMYMHQPAVWVRFPGVQIETDTHTLGPDGPVTVGPYADIYMRCFEIEPTK